MTQHDTTPAVSGPGKSTAIVLAEAGNSWWLVEGEDHLEALLSADAPYPTPVHCVVFDTLDQLAGHLPGGVAPNALWSLHPAIVKRLKDQGELNSVPASALV